MITAELASKIADQYVLTADLKDALDELVKKQAKEGLRSASLEYFIGSLWGVDSRGLRNTKGAPKVISDFLYDYGYKHVAVTINDNGILKIFFTW